MKVLEALKILEDATLECKDRPINAPEVKEALGHDHDLRQHGLAR